jgi:hypothetical protein
MKNGRLYDANTLDEVYPRARPLPRQLWMEPEPARTPLTVTNGTKQD